MSTHTPETAFEQIQRVELMADDIDGESWDLSDNDRAALCTVLRQRADLLKACHVAFELLSQMDAADDSARFWRERVQLAAAIERAEGKGQAA